MKKRGIFLLLAVFLVCITFTVTGHAAGTFTESGSTKIADYGYAVKCHTVPNGDGSTTVMYSVWNGTQLSLYVDRFSASGSRLSHRSVSLPGKSWGGTVYHGPDGCYYVATGNGSDIAFYISKYSADWRQMGVASISKKDVYTSLAFEAGNSDMTLVGNTLIVHTSRQMMSGHQANATFYIDKNTMRPITVETGFNYVSHSLTQFVRSDGNQVMMVDLGDGSPRDVLFQTYTLRTDAVYNKDAQNYRRFSLIDIKGGNGNSHTGVTVDGFELGSSNHVVVGTSIPHDTFASDSAFSAYQGGNNIYVSLIDKNLQGSTFKWLTSYSDTHVRNLECIRINGDRFLLLYGTEDVSGNQKTCYMMIDSRGNVQRTGSIARTFFCSSEPSLNGNVLTWCHYVESKLGHFLIMNRWNIATGEFSIRNLDTGIKSNISKLDSKKKHTITSKKVTSLLMTVYSDVLKDGPAITPAVWTSSNPKVLEILDEEKMLNDSVLRYGEPAQIVSTRVKARKSGKVTVTCQIGDKTRKIKVKVKVKASKKNKAAKKPAKTAITRLSPKGKKAMKVTWKKKKGVTGYQICYAANKNFRKYKKITIKKSATTARVIKGLKRKKTYYVKIRTYKNVKKNGKQTKVYSKWSAKKKIRLK